MYKNQKYQHGIILSVSQFPDDTIRRRAVKSRRVASLVHHTEKQKIKM